MKDERMIDLCIYFILLFWIGFCRLSDFLYFFHWLIINYKDKCIQTQTFETQVCLFMAFALINDIIQVHVIVLLTKKKNLSLINQYYNTMSSPDNSRTFLFYLYVKYDTRWNVARPGFQKQNKGTLITHNSINK